ncbi:hypothetical protein [Siccirubricoccus deserti]|uniref:Uncharacterized protein n=1 Tax=Siccirubricoccus deserti TaxID=2013562 RepID=A0A9X0R3N7_9PROT|nr:hypothetical protein [Siccirubricoccus deserti]MBC4017932.1 hypothetical protein [Siccirubricoccus deserti]
MAGSEDQRQWCIRVLNLDPAGASGNRGEPILGVWRDAKEAVDARLEALGRTLRGLGDPDLDQIAQYGLFGLTGGGQTVALMAALQDYDRAAPADRAAAAAAVGKAVGAYRAMLHSSPLAEALDDNPFGVEIGLLDTMDVAFRQIITAIR